MDVSRAPIRSQNSTKGFALCVFVDCGSGGCVCIPVWSFLCRQTIKITIGDHETVGDLRTKIAEELDDPNRYVGFEVSAMCSSGSSFVAQLHECLLSAWIVQWLSRFRYKPENIKLTFMSNMLFDDSQTLRDAGIHNDDTINLLVDCCYWKKSRKTCNEGAASAGLPHGEAVEEAGQGAAEAEGAVEQAAAEHNGSAAAEATQDAPLVEDAAETKE